MNGVFEAAIDIQQFCVDRGWKFCIIGGIAVIRWGRPRMTEDVDLSLLTGFAHEQSFITELCTRYQEREPGAARFALASRVYLAVAPNGVELDIAFAGFDFEEQIIERASLFEFQPGCRLLTASAEDLVVMKAFAGRPQDWMDIEGILVRQGKHLDWSGVVARLDNLCALAEKESPVLQLEEVRQRAR